MKSKGNKIYYIQYMNKIGPYWANTNDNNPTAMNETKMDNQHSHASFLSD